MDISMSSSPGSSPTHPATTASTRTIRRKRSSANAALTTRPSHLNLRADSCQPSLHSLVFVHIARAPQHAGGAVHLVRALMEPNLLIDAQGRVTRLDRETWERVRDAVEALRILGPSSSSTAAAPLPTPDQSPDLSFSSAAKSGSNLSLARSFDVCDPTPDTRARLPTSTLLMQASSRRDGVSDPSQGGTADSHHPLLAFILHGLGGDSGSVAAAVAAASASASGASTDDQDGIGQGWTRLPTPLKTLLADTEHLANHYPPGPLGPDGVCEAVLRLVQA